MRQDDSSPVADKLPQGAGPKESPVRPEQPFTVRFGRLLAGQSLDEPINDPANPNLITSRDD